MIICSKCGAELGDDQPFCPNCGTGTSSAQRTQVPAVTPAPESYSSSSEPDIAFLDCVKNFFIRIVDFKSTCLKKEFWFGFLTYIVVLASLNLLDDIPFAGFAFDIAIIAASLAFISLTVRRLNKLGLPWYRIFIYMIPVYGQIRFVIEMTR